MTKRLSTPLRLVITAALAAVLLTFGLASCGSETPAPLETAATVAEPTEPAVPTTEPIAPEPTAEEPTAQPIEVTAVAVEPTTEPAVPTAEPPTDDADHSHDDADAHDTGDHSHDADTAESTVTTATAGDYLGSYTVVDNNFGTMVTVTVADGTRTLVANSLPDHATGEFPNSGNPNTISEQALTLEFTTDPVYTGNAGFAMQPGVAINGVTFEPGTAETVTCASGENYRVEGLQDLYDLGMDFNNAHVQPTGKYHYHGIAELLVNNLDAGVDPVHIGFAADGFLMYYSPSGSYSSSYELSVEARTGTDCTGSGALRVSNVEIDGTTPDGTYGSDWNYVDGLGDLDSCNGTQINGEYAYVLTDEFPYIPRCLNGEFTQRGPGGQGGPGGGADRAAGADPGTGDGEQRPAQDGPGPGAGDGEQRPAQGGAPGGQPDFTDAAAALGVTVDELLAALGGPPPDLNAAAATLGITVEELRAVMPPPPGR